MRVWVIFAAAAAACGGGPSNGELDRLHAEAVAANAAALAAHPQAEETDALAIGGQVRAPVALPWAELQRLATAHVTTVDPQDLARPAKTDFRGVLVRDLLDRAGAAADAREITFVARDAFRATVDLADARASAMLLAVAADGAAIPLAKGGPIYLVHPWSESPAAYRDKYTDRFWAFYVIAMIVGTEVPAIRVGGKTLDRAALAALPTTTWDGVVGWKVDWPAAAVHLRGVALTDVLAAAGVALPAGGHVIVRGKAPVHRDAAHPSGIDVADLARCPPLLALAYGADEQPIPARLGGPIAMAMPPCGDRYDKDPDHHWITMVEEIEVTPP